MLWCGTPFPKGPRYCHGGYCLLYRYFGPFGFIGLVGAPKGSKGLKSQGLMNVLIVFYYGACDLVAQGFYVLCKGYQNQVLGLRVIVM